MASTFHLGAYHELADTFTLGFEGKKGEREREKGKEKKQNFKFCYELPSFFFSATSPQKTRCNIAEISPPDGQHLYKQPSPVQGAFD